MEQSALKGQYKPFSWACQRSIKLHSPLPRASVIVSSGALVGSLSSNSKFLSNGSATSYCQPFCLQSPFICTAHRPTQSCLKMSLTASTMASFALPYLTLSSHCHISSRIATCETSPVTYFLKNILILVLPSSQQGLIPLRVTSHTGFSPLGHVYLPLALSPVATRSIVTLQGASKAFYRLLYVSLPSWTIPGISACSAHSSGSTPSLLQRPFLPLLSPFNFKSTFQTLRPY